GPRTSRARRSSCGRRASIARRGARGPEGGVAAGASFPATRPAGGVNDDGRATILIVDDDEATCRVLGDNLSADGHEVLVADCARDGMRMLEYKFPDLAVVD